MLTTAPKQNRRKKRLGIFFGVAVIISIIIPQSRSIIVESWMALVRTARSTVKPILPSEDDKRSRAELEEEVQRLRVLSAQLVISNAELIDLQKENRELKDSLNYQASGLFKKIVVHNLGRPFESLRDIASIDAGASRGVIPGAAVVSPTGNLIGIVEDVRQTSSSIRLLTDHRTKIASRITGVTEGTGIVMPIEGGAIALRFLGENLTIPKTSVVVTTAIAGTLPAGLPIGTIETTTKEQETPFLRAIISPPEHFDDLDMMMVLVP